MQQAGAAVGRACRVVAASVVAALLAAGCGPGVLSHPGAVKAPEQPPPPAPEQPPPPAPEQQPPPPAPEQQPPPASAAPQPVMPEPGSALPEATAPEVVAVDPLDGAVDVDTDAAVRVRFSMPMQAASVNASTVRLRVAGGGLVAGGVAYVGDGVVFSPIEPLALLRTYSITVDGVLSASGSRPLSGKTTFSFTVRDGTWTVDPRPLGGALLAMAGNRRGDRALLLNSWNQERPTIGAVLFRKDPGVRTGITIPIGGNIEERSFATEVDGDLAIDEAGVVVAVWTSGGGVAAAFAGPGGNLWKERVVVSPQAWFPRVAVVSDCFLSAWVPLPPFASDGRGGTLPPTITGRTLQSGSAAGPKIPLGKTGFINRNVRMLGTPAGHSLLVWEDVTEQGMLLVNGGLSPESQLLLAMDKQIGSERTLLGDSAAALDDAGSAAIVWTEQQNGGQAELVLCTVRPAGAAWSPPTVLSAGDNSLSKPTVSSDGRSGFLVAWRSPAAPASEMHDIATARWSPTSGWSQPEVISDGKADAFRPKLAADGTGNVLALWIQQSGGARRTVWGARYHHQRGWAAPGELPAVQAAADDVRLTAVDEAGTAMAAWQENGQTTIAWFR